MDEINNVPGLIGGCNGTMPEDSNGKPEYQQDHTTEDSARHSIFSSDSESESDSASDSSIEFEFDSESDSCTESESESDSNQETLVKMKDWKSPATGESLKQFPYVAKETTMPMLISNNPSAFYNLFITEDIIDLIVTETNRKATQLSQIERLAKYFTNWMPTNKNEIKRFIGLMLYFGWDESCKIGDPFFAPCSDRNFCKKVMSLERFEILLKCCHFENASQENHNVSKYSRICRMLVNYFQSARQPGKEMIVAVANVAVGDDIASRRCKLGQAHKCGIRLYKLIDSSGYIYATHMSSQRACEDEDTPRTSREICVKLMKDYFGQGRTLNVGSFTLTDEFAYECLDKQTHVRGVVNKKKLPTCLQTTVNKGECKTAESDGVIFGVWKGSCHLNFITTNQLGTLVQVTNKNSTREFPDVVNDYRKCLQALVWIDERNHGFSVLAKDIRWYHKVVFEFILNICVTNAYILFKEKTHLKIKMNDFRKQLIESFTDVKLEMLD